MKNFRNVNTNEVLNEKEYNEMITREAKDNWENNLNLIVEEFKEEGKTLKQYTKYYKENEIDADFEEVIEVPKTYDEFIRELAEESESLIEEGLKNYAGSEGIYKRMYEIYEEGWELSNKNNESKEYYSNVNQYIKDYFEK